MRVRKYGSPDNPQVVLLHGGPGAPGSMAGVARGLADEFFVLEPFQRVREDTPLDVRVHIDDLHALLGDERVPLVGHSWGAMLALAYAAEHPVAKLILVGCGTFDPAARAEFERRRAAATGDHVDALTEETEEVAFDEAGHKETWADMLRLQADGTYPAAFARIEAPVVLIHGDQDSHPGRMIADSLRPHVARLTYMELERCGHYPWVERHASAAFFHVLKDALRRQRRV